MHAITAIIVAAQFIAQCREERGVAGKMRD
jgi:hypothetical protein